MKRVLLIAIAAVWMGCMVNAQTVDTTMHRKKVAVVRKAWPILVC